MKTVYWNKRRKGNFWKYCLGTEPVLSLNLWQNQKINSSVFDALWNPGFNTVQLTSRVLTLSHQRQRWRRADFVALGLGFWEINADQTTAMRWYYLSQATQLLAWCTVRISDWAWQMFSFTNLVFRGVTLYGLITYPSFFIVEPSLCRRALALGRCEGIGLSSWVTTTPFWVGALMREREMYAMWRYTKHHAESAGELRRRNVQTSESGSRSIRMALKQVASWLIEDNTASTPTQEQCS